MDPPEPQRTASVEKLNAWNGTTFTPRRCKCRQIAVPIQVLPLRALVPATITDGVLLPRLRRVLRQSEPNKVCCFIEYRQLFAWGEIVKPIETRSRSCRVLGQRSEKY
jgi:hypothetical protein